MSFNAIELKQAWAQPTRTLPIVIIGAGGIVNDAHLPAYKKAGLKVLGIFDIDRDRAMATAQRWEIPNVYESLDAAVSQDGVVFDLALPPGAIVPVLKALPVASGVLIQKPMGNDLAHAREIVQTCEERQLRAAVNHQLRFSPDMLAVRDALQRGWLGEITDVEMHLNIADPWHLFPFLENLERVEIQVHSIHYLDLIRSLLGEPQGVYALTLPDTRFPKVKSTRSSIILNYGHSTRVCLSLNHNYAHGEQGQSARFKFEGTKGVIFTQIGVMLDYPKGRPNTFEFKHEDQEWQQLPLRGSWFPDAFVGPMANLQRYLSGEDAQLVTSVQDVLKTMALVEACYLSSASGGQALPATEMAPKK